MSNLRFVGLDDAGRLLLRGDGEQAGVDLERVQRFARPVLQEREHVAASARQVVVRAAGAEAPLEELVDSRLGADDTDARAWDAWRREDGRWTVELTFADTDDTRTARWTYDPHTRSVTVDDETARAITEGTGVAAPTGPPAEAAPAPEPAPRRLLSVPDLAPEGADAEGYDEDEIADELAALGLQPVEAGEPATPAAAATHDTLTLDLDGDAPAREPSPAPARARRATEASPAPAADDAATPAADGAAKKKPAKKATRRSKRASVPSWDDIVFGARKPE